MQVKNLVEREDGFQVTVKCDQKWYTVNVRYVGMTRKILTSQMPTDSEKTAILTVIEDIERKNTIWY